jgi:hypothetical protein
MATQKDLERALTVLYAQGHCTVRAATVAAHLWPDQRYHNTRGQVFPLAAGVAARMLNRSKSVVQIEPRLWRVIAEYLHTD